MADMVIDPLTNSMYTVYASGSVASLNNSIYKHEQPYSAATKVWNVPSGYTVLQEAANRPYLSAGGLNDNSANLIAVNPTYLFYWDGRNLKAFSKATGALAGTPVTTTGIALQQGGIIADACNNVFVGDVNGTVKVYTFNGVVFDDAAAPDISIAGFTTGQVYDLAYNETQKLLYVSGNGFVASVDVSAYCPNTVYGLAVTPNCASAGAAAALTPAPPAGSTVTYTLFNGTQLVTSNTTGLFTALIPGTSYKITATINEACSGTQATAGFVMPGPLVVTVTADASCNTASGTIIATGSGTTPPYLYSIDGTNFVAGGTFGALTAGIYTIHVKDNAGCITATPVTLLNANGPAVTFTKTDAACGNSNATVTAVAAGGIPPYQYSIDAGNTYRNSPFFTALTPGQHILMVKDAAGCTNAAIVTITSSALPLLNAIPASASCNGNNGIINAFGSGGLAPYQYSINGNTFQATNTFANLTPGPYTVTVKDANGCSQTTSVVINNTPAPTVTAIPTQAACANANGAITATGSGGLAPLSYSINGGAFQANNFFGGLAGGNYTITVQDIAGCTGSANVAVTSVSAGPTVTATATASACNVNNGSITVLAAGGLPPYQYSLNNTAYQAGTLFATLAPGNYVAYGKDNAGCVNTFSVVVPPTSGPVLSVTVTPSSCLANDGTISATATGGTGALSYSIDGVTFVPVSNFTGLAPNIYTVTAKDANGCSRSKVVTVDNASGLSLTVAALASSCSGNSGIITLTADGGVLPLQYSIDGTTYQPSNVFASLAPGNYTGYVKDANGCVISKATTVTSISAPLLTLNVLNATCNTASGAIRATGTGGVAPLTYNIDGGAFSTMNAFVNLAAGSHTVIVKDAGGCTFSQSVTVTNSAAASAPTDVTFTLRNAFPCTGGVVKIKNLKGVPGGGGNHYQFSLDFGAYTGSNQFTNVPPGNHIITALNDNGCTVSRIAVVSSGIPATATATATGTPCNTTNGSITITGVGGSVPYHASIDGSSLWQTFFPPGSNTFTFNNLAPGLHTITMADDADFTVGPPDIPGACLTAILVTVPTVGGPVLAVSKFDGTCVLGDGSITATGTGISPFTFNINGNAYQASGSFTNLATGLYSINMKDANGCTSSTTVNIVNPTGPIISTSVTPASCNLSNGIITVTSTNGVGLVQYSIDGFSFQAGGVFDSLAAGNYTVYAKDANGCYSAVNVTVTAIPSPSVTAFTIAASCGISDGTVFTTASSGSVPYQYSLNGTVYQSSSVFAGLAAGFYNVTLKDSRGCTTTTGVALSNIGAPSLANTPATATCGNSNGSTTITAAGGTAPYTYSKDGFIYQASNTVVGLPAGNNIIRVKDDNGCIAQKLISVSNAAGPQSVTATVSDASCGMNNGTISVTAAGGTPPLEYSTDGIVYQPANIFNGIPAGIYTIVVKDANLCAKTLPVTIQQLTGPQVTGAFTSPASCTAADGTITVNATGGTGTLSYSINAAPFQTGNIFSGLTSGNYSIIVKDNKGCFDTISNAAVTALSNMLFSAAHTDPTCGNNDGTITLTASAGAAPYQYAADGVSFQSSNVFTSLSAGTYVPVVKDANGCTVSTTVSLAAAFAGSKTWLGVNNNWQDPVNWCGGVPAIADNVLIPSGLLHYPVISTGTGYAKKITIQTGASVVVTSGVTIADSIINQGSLDAVQGTVELAGTSKQVIAGSMFVQHTIHHLVISNSSVAGVEVAATAGDTLKISRAISFGYDDAVLATGDNVTLLSSDTATASLGIIKERADGTPRVTINGNMIVERYYPRKRAWRFITAPFKPDAASPSINASWQEGAPPSITGVSNPDPHPTYGTHITGPYSAVTAYSPVVTSSGFDQSPQNNSSLKYYNPAINSFSPVSNTFTTKVTDRQGFLMFVRGDRSYDIGTTNNFMTPTGALLRVRGNVNSGLVSVPADTGLQVIGNPYPSAIRLDDLVFAQNAAILKNTSFWLWDPLRGSAANSPANVGGWVPVVYAGSGIYVSTYNPTQSVAGLDSAHVFEIDGTVQSGAAFMIDNKATATGNFVLHESSKIDGSNNHQFRPATTNQQQLMISIFRNGENGKPVYWADGAMLLMDDSWQNDFHAEEDVRKIFGAGENIAVQNGSEKVAIEKRKLPSRGDTIFLYTNRLKTGSYRFEIYFVNAAINGLVGYFEDTYSGTSTLLPDSGHVLTDINITDDPASLRSDRFRIVFRPLMVLPLMQVALSAWEENGKVALTWAVNNQQHTERYVAERSIDGHNFYEIASVMGRQDIGATMHYATIDPQPLTGNNYYRLRIIKPDGNFFYSMIVFVSVAPGISYLQVSPNPAQSNCIRLVMKQVQRGKYKYGLYDVAGKQVLKGELQHSGGTNVYTILPAWKLDPGTYKLVLIASALKRTVLNVNVLE